MTLPLTILFWIIAGLAGVFALVVLVVIVIVLLALGAKVIEKVLDWRISRRRPAHRR